MKVDWPTVDDGQITEHQKEELSKATRKRIGILTGGPGCGKTFVAARVIGKLLEKFGREQIAVTAPTGKAAVRITETMQDYSIDIQATTIHRLLGVESNVEGEGWGFKHNENNPLEQRFIIVDESSMICTDLMRSLMAACYRNSHLLFLGDCGQLPPVGHGAPLRDFIAAGVPSGELRVIHRNSGAIVQACAEMRDGKRFQTSKVFSHASGENLVTLETVDGKASVERIVKAVKKIRENKPAHPETGKIIDPVWDVQIIVAVNKKSDLSRRDLNKRLQAELNPTGRRSGNNPFRVGDKIVCLKNGLLPLVDGESAQDDDDEDGGDGNSAFVANGELGEVISVEEKITVAKFEGPERLVKIPRGNGDDKEKSEESDDDDSTDAGTGCSFDLGYAISCHKSQGSEWPVVIVALDEYPGARRVCSREWLYTAVSRGKLVVYMVGKLAIAHSMTLRRALPGRKTFLKELIQGEASKDARSDQAENKESLATVGTA